MSDTDKQVQRILESYKAAVWTKDVEAFMRLYDTKARVFDAWGVWSYEGSSAWRVAVEGWFGSLGAESVKATFESIQTDAGPDFATVSAIVRYAAMSPQGEEMRAMHNRITWALKKSGHVLRIVHEHTSAPMGFEDMKAILQRQER